MQWSLGLTFARFRTSWSKGRFSLLNFCRLAEHLEAIAGNLNSGVQPSSCIFGFLKLPVDVHGIFPLARVTDSVGDQEISLGLCSFFIFLVVIRLKRLCSLA